MTILQIIGFTAACAAQLRALWHAMVLGAVFAAADAAEELDGVDRVLVLSLGVMRVLGWMAAA